MPYFTRQVAPNGSLMMPAFIGVSNARFAALEEAGHPLPTPVPVSAMVDTGASCTCVDPSILQNLGLTPTGTASILTSSTGRTAMDVDQYDVSIYIVASANQAPLSRGIVPVIASELLSHHGFHVLLGMDILRECLLTYDGLNGTFSLAY